MTIKERFNIAFSETKALIHFVKLQTPKLQQSTLKKHGIGYKQIFIWVLILALTQSSLNTAFVILDSPQVLSSYRTLFSIPLLSVYILLFFFGSGFLFMAWLQYEQKESFELGEWWEFYFLCYIPLFLAGLMSPIIMTFFGGTFAFLLGSLCFAFTLHLLHLGIKARFISTAKQYRTLKGIVFGIGILYLLNQWGLISPLTSMKTPLTQKSSAPEWTPEFPTETEKKIRVLYETDKKKEKAALQYAKSLWNFLDLNQDFEKRDNDLGRAVVCLDNTFSDDVSTDEMKKIKSIVFWNMQLTRKFLEEDYRHSGFYDIPPDEGSCDP